MLMKYENNRRGSSELARTARRFWLRLAHRLREWLVVQRDIGRLDQLDDRLLEDMGVPRGEISARVKGRRPAAGHPADRSMVDRMWAGLHSIGSSRRGRT